MAFYLDGIFSPVFFRNPYLDPPIFVASNWGAHDEEDRSLCEGGNGFIAQMNRDEAQPMNPLLWLAL